MHNSLESSQFYLKTTHFHPISGSHHWSSCGVLYIIWSWPTTTPASPTLLSCRSRTLLQLHSTRQFFVIARFTRVAPQESFYMQSIFPDLLILFILSHFSLIFVLLTHWVYFITRVSGWYVVSSLLRLFCFENRQNSLCYCEILLPVWLKLHIYSLMLLLWTKNKVHCLSEVELTGATVRRSTEKCSLECWS